MIAPSEKYEINWNININLLGFEKGRMLSYNQKRAAIGSVFYLIYLNDSSNIDNLYPFGKENKLFLEYDQCKLYIYGILDVD